MDECVREMTFEEEYEILKREANKLFDSEIDGCETPKANCIVRRALRCIDKLTKENKLAKEYRELEEKGRLLKLPCKIGDCIWWISDEDEEGNKVFCPRKCEEPISLVGIDRDGDFVVSVGEQEKNPIDKLGSRWALLTKEEAEAKLKEMEREKDA